MNIRQFLGSLRVQLYLIVICSLLPTLLILLYAGHERRLHEIDDFGRQAQLIVESMAQQQIRLADSTRQILLTLSRLPEVRELRQEELGKLLSNALEGDGVLLNLLVADPQGRIVASAYPLPEALEAGDRKYFRDALSTLRFSAGEYVQSRSVGVPTIHFAYPVVERGELRCVLIAPVRLSSFSSFFKAVKLPELSVAGILDHAGVRLHCYPEGKLQIGAPASPATEAKIKAGEDSGVFEAEGGDGVRRVIAFQKVRLAPGEERYMTVVVGAPVAAAMARADAVARDNLASLAAAAAIGLLASWLVGSRVVMRRVEALLTAARAIGAGDLSVRVDARCRGGEMGQLAAAFDDMAQRLQRREEALKASQARYKTLFENAPLGILVTDASGAVLEANPALLAITGAPSLEAMREVDVLSTPRLVQAGIAGDFRLCLEDGTETVSERSYVTRWGKELVLRLRLRPLGSTDSPEGAHALVEDITESVRAKNDLLLYKKIFDCAQEGITITDAQGKILAVNPAFTRITGYSEREALGRTPRVLKSDRHDKAFYRAMWRSLIETGEWAGEIWNRRKSGEVYPELLSISAIRDVQDRTGHYVALFHDITEMKRTEAKIVHLAFHDALTGLPNRLLLTDRLRRAIAHAKRIKRNVAVLFIDLDNFKTINDSLGHPIGDELLRQAAERIATTIRQDDTLARLGGDEFVIMAEELPDEEEPVRLAERVIQSFAAPLQVLGREMFITPSIGVTLFPGDGEDAETLIKNADMAMYLAKEQGKNRFRLFHAEMNERVRRRMSMEHKVRKALEAGEFEPWFQPKVDARTGETVGMEALARWRTPEGVVSPAEFIPLAEETGLIVPLGDSILEQACAAARRFLDEGIRLEMAVNISPKQFRQPDVGERVLAALERAGLPPELLQIEITESTVMGDVQRTALILHELVERGVGVSLDDFGTGYSSLYYLKQFPISSLKVDQSFVRDITRDPSDATIVGAIIRMAEALGLSTVAEGVETREQYEFLLREKCDVIQGYYFGKPMPEEEFRAWLKARKQAA